MAEQAGRLMLVKKNGTTIAGVRQNGFTVNGVPVSIESQTDNGFATYLSGVKTGRQITINCEGVETDQVLRDISLASDAAGGFMGDLTLEAPNGDTLSGSWVLTDYAETGAFEEAVTFTATIISDGEWTYAKGV